MSFTIRPAAEADRTAILALMRPGDYNRINLKPACFLVAEEAGRVIGIGQVKRHRDGAWELASLVVAADRRGQGVGGALLRALSARHTGDLYLLCLAPLEGYYERFGFRRAASHTLPRSLARMVWAGNVIGRAPVVFGRARLRVIAMRRAPSHEPND
ncbi:MAG: GNAT family N-acetyltransferase [Caldilineaceae bacterium]|nr:GNAT family N-acetyltransferase [Caldilineaceae bacterium]